MSNFIALKAPLLLILRMTIFSFIFITPLAAFTVIAADTGGKMTATGLVLFVSLQK